MLRRYQLWTKLIQRIATSIVVLMLSVGSLLTTTTPALAAAIVVNTTNDTSDAAPGDGLCADVGGDCSVRAAIEELNATAGGGAISIPAGTYIVESRLVIDEDINIAGAGADLTFLDGGNTNEILGVRAVEWLVCDSATHSVASYTRNAYRNPDHIPHEYGDLTIPGDVAAGPKGTVYVAGYGSGVHLYDVSGDYQGLFVAPDDVPESEFHPTALLLGEDSHAPDYNTLYIADYYPGSRILTRNIYSGDVTTLVPTGLGGLSTPSDMAFYKGELFVSDTGSSQILRYHAETGDFLGVFANLLTDGYTMPRGLVFHNGSLYITSESTDTVLQYDAETGGFIDAFVTAGSGGLEEPGDLRFGPDGNLYVVSAKTGQILRYSGTTGAFLGTFLEADGFHLGNPSCLEWRTGSRFGPHVNIGGLTIQNGKTQYSTSPTAGLVIERGASVDANRIVVRNNTSSITGGGIYNAGFLTLHDSEVSRNTLPIGGGGQTSAGGGIYNTGTLYLIRSLVVDNVATRGGGITNGGYLGINDSTISGNRSVGKGGGLYNGGDGRAQINFATITNNATNEVFPGAFSESDPFGGGIYSTSSAKIAIANSILAGNRDNRTRYDADYSPDCYTISPGMITSQRDNVVGILTSNCAFEDYENGGTGFDQVGTPEAPLDARLKTLGWNGGHTRTHALYSDSPAIDFDLRAASEEAFECNKADQRLVARPSGRTCDSGAYELVQGIGVAGPGELKDVNMPPTGLDQIGLRARLTNPAGEPLKLSAMLLDGSPVPVGLVAPNERYLMLSAANAETSDSVTLHFYYPATVESATERSRSFQLLYFDGQSWQPMRGADGKLAVKDTTNNLDQTRSGGRFSMVLNATSQPALTQLQQVVIVASN